MVISTSLDVIYEHSGGAWTKTRLVQKGEWGQFLDIYRSPPMNHLQTNP